MGFNNGVFSTFSQTVNFAYLITDLIDPIFSPPSGINYNTIYSLSINPSVNIPGTGTIGSLAGLYVNPTVVSGGTGTATNNVYGIYIDQINVSNATNAYGLYINTPTGASVNNISAFFTSAPEFGSPLEVISGGTGATTLTLNTDGVIYFDGTKFKSTTSGNAGQFLTSQGLGSPPIFSSTFLTPITVPNGGTGQTVLTSYGVLLGEGSNSVHVTTAGTNGQVLIGSSTGDPSFGSITSSGGTLAFTSGPGSLNIESTGTFLNTVTVPYGGTGRTVLTLHGVLIGEGSNNINVTAQGTNGQVLIGSSTGDPSFGSITSSGGTLAFTSGPGSLNIDIMAPVSVPYGGTGQTVLTSYGVLLGEGSNSVHVTTAGTNGQVLIGSSTGDPSFGSITSSGGTLAFTSGPGSLNIDIMAPVSVPYGGTGQTVLTSYGVLLGEGSNSVHVTTAGTNGQVLIGSSTGDPSFGSITSSGGTLAFTSGPGSLNIESTGTFLNTVTVPYGGTGRTVLTLYGVLIGEGSNNINVTTQGTNGQVLIGSSTGDPSFGSITSSGGTLAFTSGPGSLNIDIMAPVSVPYGGTGQTILTSYGVLLGEGSNSVHVTTAGTNGQVLIGSSTGDPSFGSITSSGGTLAFTSGPGSLNIDIMAPVSVPYGGTGQTVLTSYGVLLGEGSNSIHVTTAGTNGQVLIGSSTGDPSFGSITSSGNTLQFSSGPGSLNIDLVTPVIIINGGTNATSFNTDGVVYFDGTRLNSTTAGNSGQILTSQGLGLPPIFTSIGILTDLQLTGTLCAMPPAAILTVSTVYSISGATVTANLYDILANSTFTAAPGYTYQNVYGESIIPTITTAGSGSVGNVTGLYINPLIAGGGTGTATANVYGLFIDSISASNTMSAYGIYVNTPTGASVSNISGYFQGTVGFGTTAIPSAANQVQIGNNAASVTTALNISPNFTANGTALNGIINTPTFLSANGGPFVGFNDMPAFNYIGGGTTTITTTSGLHIGTTVSPTNMTGTLTLTNTYSLHVTGTVTSASNTAFTNVYGIASDPTVTTSGTGYIVGYATLQANSTLNLTGTGTPTANAYGLMIGGTFTSNSGTSIANVYGESITPTVSTSGTGSVGTVTGLYINPVVVNSGTGTPTANVYGAFINSISVSNTTNAYGLYVLTPTGASVNNVSAYFQGLVELGPVTYPYKSVTTSYAVSAATDYMISVNSQSTSGVVITLPVAPAQNQVFIVKDRTGYSANNPIMIGAGAGQSIDMQYTSLSTLNLTNPYGSFTLLFHDSNYEIV